jgi:hypothetical protein
MAAFLLIFYLDISPNMNVKTSLLSVLILMLITSCSGTYHAYSQTLKIAFSEQVDAQKTLAQVQQSEIDIISVKRGDRAAAIMALAYLENGQHKWVSNDNAMLIMKKGRLIRTIGFSDNLLYLSNIENDPLKLLTGDSQGSRLLDPWLRIADRTGDEYGYLIKSIFSQGKQDILQALNLQLDTIYYVETVHYNAPTEYVRLVTSWENHFWFSKDGRLIKSIQKISPVSESLEITYLSRIARLNQ